MTSAMGNATPITTSSLPYSADNVVASASLGLMTCTCCMEADGREGRLIGGRGACAPPPDGPYNTGWRDSDPPKEGGLDNRNGDSMCTRCEEHDGAG